MSCCGFNGNGGGIDSEAGRITDVLYDDYLLASGGHPCQSGGDCQCGGQCQGGYSNVDGDIPPDPADGQPREDVAPTMLDELKMTSAVHEGYEVDPLKKKLEPYIIGGLVMLAVLFVAGMVKIGRNNDNVQIIK